MRNFNWKRGLIAGGVLVGLIVLSFYPIVHGHSSEPDVSYDLIHNCLPIPDDVPETYAGGTPIEWDCEMNSFYKDGRLKLYYNDEGGLVMIEKQR